MTASTSTSFDLGRDGIIRLAYQLVGSVAAGTDPDPNQIALASDLLNVTLKALENEGIYLSKLERTTTTLVTGQAQYTTASDTLDIDGGTPYVTDANGNDFPLTMIPRAQYMALVDKEMQSQPTMMYVEKASTVSFFLYPTPDSTNYVSVTYPRTKIMTDMDTGAVTTGLPSRYLKTVAFMLAADLAFHHGLLEKQAALERKSLAEKQLARGDDTERGNLRFVPDYGRKFGSRW